jgi:ElaB/YqjD/DUF883 family membrane-anchored ribosome-binding protein
VARRTADKITEAGGKIQQSVTALNPRFEQAEAVLKPKTNAAAISTDDYVHANPWIAVGVSVSVGMLVGRRQDARGTRPNL